MVKQEEAGRWVKVNLNPGFPPVQFFQICTKGGSSCRLPAKVK
jgi:hypothetical protein